MDPMTRLLIRLAQWFRHPPSPTQIKVILATLVICVILVLIEKFVGWPDWATAQRVPILRH